LTALTITSLLMVCFLHSLADCLLKLGEWKIAMVEPGEVVDRSTRREVLALYGRATLVDPQSYRAWHQWGLSNYRAIEEARGSTGRIQSAGVLFCGMSMSESHLFVFISYHRPHYWDSLIAHFLRCSSSSLPSSPLPSPHRPSISHPFHQGVPPPRLQALPKGP
jgi:hypothetical protein